MKNLTGIHRKSKPGREDCAGVISGYSSGYFANEQMGRL